MRGCRPNCPLMINNLHCAKNLFRDYVSQVCLAVVNDLNVSAIEKWKEFIMQMEGVIKITGKWYAHKAKKETEKHVHILQSLRQKANALPLTVSEE